MALTKGWVVVTLSARQEALTTLRRQTHTSHACVPGLKTSNLLIDPKGLLISCSTASLRSWCLLTNCKVPAAQLHRRHSKDQRVAYRLQTGCLSTLSGCLSTSGGCLSAATSWVSDSTGCLSKPGGLIINSSALGPKTSGGVPALAASTVQRCWRARPGG